MYNLYINFVITLYFLNLLNCKKYNIELTIKKSPFDLYLNWSYFFVY